MVVFVFVCDLNDGVFVCVSLGLRREKGKAVNDAVSYFHIEI